MFRLLPAYRGAAPNRRDSWATPRLVALLERGLLGLRRELCSSQLQRLQPLILGRPNQLHERAARELLRLVLPDRRREHRDRTTGSLNHLGDLGYDPGREQPLPVEHLAGLNDRDLLGVDRLLGDLRSVVVGGLELAHGHTLQKEGLTEVLRVRDTVHGLTVDDRCGGEFDSGTEVALLALTGSSLRLVVPDVRHVCLNPFELVGMRTRPGMPFGVI